LFVPSTRKKGPFVLTEGAPLGNFADMSVATVCGEYMNWVASSDYRRRRTRRQTKSRPTPGLLPSGAEAPAHRHQEALSRTTAASPFPWSADVLPLCVSGIMQNSAFEFCRFDARTLRGGEV
jgi:hypothetical protein